MQTHWKKLVNPKYIGAYCVENDITVTITAVVRETVKGENGKEEECTVAYLQDQKPFILNRTNCKTITKIYNTPYIEDWAGKDITIYPTTTRVAGETVECLRIRPTKPEQIDVTEQIKQLEACTTLAELAAAFKSFTKKQQLATVATKDIMKGKLK